MRWIDRAVAWASPERALRRARARAALRVLEQAYDGASAGRRTDGWIRPSTSADAELRPALARLRNGARDLGRNSPYVSKALRVIASTAVGTGIRVQLEDDALQALFRDWVEQCDAEGQHTFYGMQSVMARAVPESGEALVRLRPRRLTDGLAVPLQIQLLEADHLDSSKDGAIAGGGWISMGIEYNAIGRRVAYWLYPVHPGESGIASSRRRALVSQRIPAESIVHLFHALRPGQTRGVPWLAPSMIKARDLDDYEDAELVRKKIEACNVGVVTQPQGTEGPQIGLPRAPATKPPSDDPQQETVRPLRDADGYAHDHFEPGMFLYATPGQTVSFNDPKISAAYAPYVRTQLHAIAAGIGVTYQQLTGDLSQASYASGRQGKLEFEALIKEYRWLCLIPALSKIIRAFVDTAVLAGRVPEPDYRVKFQPPRFQSVDPLKDSMAKLIDVRSGFVVWEDAVAEAGYDPDVQLERIRVTNERLDAAGITLDSDPRRVTRAGASQTVDPASLLDKE